MIKNINAFELWKLSKITITTTTPIITTKEAQQCHNTNSRSSLCSLVGAASLMDIRGCLLMATRFISLFDSENISDSISQTHTQYHYIWPAVGHIHRQMIWRGPIFITGWLVEYLGLTSHQTHYRSYRGRVLRVKWRNQQCQSTEGRS